MRYLENFMPDQEKVGQEYADDANVQKMVQFVRDAGKRRLTTPRDAGSHEDND